MIAHGQRVCRLSFERMLAPPERLYGDGIGSNSWVVAGSHTTTGKPLLANDPHLAPSIPGIWYQMGLHCRAQSPACPFDVAGSQRMADRR